MKTAVSWSVAIVTALLIGTPWTSVLADGSATSGGGPGTPGYREEKQEHPNIRKAIHALHGAIKYMQKAPHDFGGHREEAVKDSEEAIKQLQLALEFREGKGGGSGGTNNNGTAAGNTTGGAGGSPATVTPGGPGTPGYQEEKTAHPQIAHAIHALREAIAYMQKAPHDFGGHRADAVQASETAIAQLQLALEYREGKDNKHAAANKP